MRGLVEYYQETKMLNMTKDIIKYILIGAILIFSIVNFLNPKIEYVDVPVRIEVPVPVIEKVHDTVYVPKPYEVLVESPVNEELTDSLSKANTVIDSLKAYKDFTVKRKYTQVFDDSTQTITVFAETTGTLDALQASYKTKPRTVVLDTVLSIPVPKYNEFYGGFSVGMPINEEPAFGVTPILKADLYLKTKTNRIISLSLDTRQHVFIGYAWRF